MNEGLQQATSISNLKETESSGLTSLTFSLKEGVGALAGALDVFKNYGVSLSFIESRVAKEKKDCYDFVISIKNSNGHINKVVEQLKQKIGSDVLVLSRNQKTVESAPWFPQHIEDLDQFATNILSFAEQLGSDQPGFNDEAYKKRRKEFAEIAFNYNKVRKFLQLNTLSKKSKPERTGFRLRPVAGLLSSRDFLSILAFRVFPVTQYIRHHSKPLYTPDPDVCHELIGHVPLFADPGFAQFSQEIGLASLGAPDEWIEKLATCYWFTVEFGMCKQNGELKAYGAGLLSSFGELQYCLSGKPEMRPFDPIKTSVQTYPVTEYQTVYFVADSFESAKLKLREFCKLIPRPFAVRYNPYTESVEVIDKKEKLLQVASDIQGDVSVLREALERLS